MSILHFRSIERRRTTRSSMTIDVSAFGENEDGSKFRFLTKTTSVAAHGGVMLLARTLTVGQQFFLINEYTKRKATARLTGVRESREGTLLGAFEFVERGENFWSMVFPAAGAKPLRRFVSKPRVSGTN